MSVNTPSGGNKFSKLLLTIFVLSLLTIFPLFALYMSSSGLKANKSLKSEMKSYKDSLRLPELRILSLTSGKNDFLNQTYDKILVLNFLDLDCKNCYNSLKEVKRIHSEFIKKTKRIKFVTVVTSKDSLININEILHLEKIDTSSWNFVKIVEQKDIAALLKIKNEISSTVVLVDRKGIVANYYNSKIHEDINNLMRHATMLIPAKEDRRKIKFKRETELYN